MPFSYLKAFLLNLIAQPYRVRFLIVTYIMVPTALGVFALILEIPISDFLSLGFGVVRTVSAGFFAVAFLGLIFVYLQGGFSSGRREEGLPRDSAMELARLRRQVEAAFDEQRARFTEQAMELESLVQSLREQATDVVKLTEEDRAGLMDEIRSELRKEVSEDFLNEIRDSLAPNSELQHKLRSVERYHGRLESRLGTELLGLGRRGNLNLALGILTALVGLGVMYMTVFAKGGELNSAAGVLQHYIPRISMVIFIEVFAYFFLRLYKSSLKDIKYYQNELTMAELRFAALDVSLREASAQLLQRTVDAFASTDRNQAQVATETARSDDWTEDGPTRNISIGRFIDKLSSLWRHND